MNLPNYITLFRILVVPVFIILVNLYTPAHSEFVSMATGIFLLAVLSDGLDGFIARKFNQKTKLGTFLDPFADKLLLISAFIVIGLSPAFAIKPPFWVVFIIIFRDFLFICGMIIIFFTTNTMRINPNMLGKLTTVLQMLTVFSLLHQWRYSPTIWTITIIFTVLSAISYTTREIKFLNRHGHN